MTPRRRAVMVRMAHLPSYWRMLTARRFHAKAESNERLYPVRYAWFIFDANGLRTDDCYTSCTAITADVRIEEAA